jgi:nitrite reductase/ring-hydroxylating ferredoxin subunit
MKCTLCCLIALLGLSACDKGYVSSIPNYPVYLELDLNYEDKDLQKFPYAKLLTPTNISQDGELTGFGGVWVYHNFDAATGRDVFYAFDAACPYEASRTIRVEMDDVFMYAVCPKCQSKYDLYSGYANPVAGPGRERLKPYTVTTVGNKVYVRN